MRLVSRVTAPLRANSEPRMTAPVLAVIDVRARIDPMNLEATPSVAELPTCQNTLHAAAPLISSMLLSGEVMTVDPAWKMKTAFGSPWASRTSVPVIASDVGDV